MEKIDSFKKDHNTLEKGFYLSGTKNGISTFDLRFKKPNANDFISQKALHSIEHMLATILRNDNKDNIVYFGPMGCRTGFYLLTVNMSLEEVKSALISAINTAIKMEEIPGSSKIECGNYLEHDIINAKEELKEYLTLLI